MTKPPDKPSDGDRPVWFYIAIAAALIGLLFAPAYFGDGLRQSDSTSVAYSELKKRIA